MVKREIRNLSAIEITDLTGQNRRLEVSVEIQTFNSNETPHLSEANPQGINPKELILEATVTASGSGATVVGWKKAGLVKPVSAGQYTSVRVRSGAEEKSVQVQVVHP